MSFSDHEASCRAWSEFPTALYAGIDELCGGEQLGDYSMLLRTSIEGNDIHGWVEPRQKIRREFECRSCLRLKSTVERKRHPLCAQVSLEIPWPKASQETTRGLRQHVI